MKALSVALLFLLAPVALTQTQASFTPYGTACNGMPSSRCLAQNDGGPNLTVASLPNEYGYPVINTTSSAIQVIGFDIYTVTNTAATETVNTAVLRDDAGAGSLTHTLPAFTAEALGTITVDAVQGWYSTTTYPPMTIQPGEAFWIAHDCFSRVAPAENNGGVPGPAAPHWRRPTYNGNNWQASSSVTNPIFRIQCLTGSPTAPALLATSLPQLGGSFTMQVSGGTPNLPAFLIFSLDNTQWLAMPTPVDLVLFGAPDCFAYTANEIVSLVLLDAAGQGASAPLAIPNDPSLDGVTWWNQAATISPGANALDLLVTNAGTAVVGN